MSLKGTVTLTKDNWDETVALFRNSLTFWYWKTGSIESTGFCKVYCRLKEIKTFRGQRTGTRGKKDRKSTECEQVGSKSPMVAGKKMEKHSKHWRMYRYLRARWGLISSAAGELIMAEIIVENKDLGVTLKCRVQRSLLKLLISIHSF